MSRVVMAVLLAGTPLSGQSVGIAISGSTARSSPVDVSVLDPERGIGLTILLRPMASSGYEAHLEVTNSTRKGFVADAIRWSATVSRAWRSQLGPLRVSALGGVGVDRTQINAALENPDFLSLHGRVATRLDAPLFPSARVFAEVAGLYSLVLPAGRRALERVASPSPPCTSGLCVTPYNAVWTATLRGGVMATFF